MKQQLFLFVMCTFALVGCEDKNGVKGYNMLKGEQAKNFSVSSYIYETIYDPTIENYLPPYTILFADSFRCQALYYNDNNKRFSKDYYYEIDYPYISLYSVSGMYGWKHDKDGNFVVDYLTKEELVIEGIAGILRFTKDTSELIVDKFYSDCEFFYQEKPMEIDYNKVEDPNSLFPIPDIP